MGNIGPGGAIRKGNHFPWCGVGGSGTFAFSISNADIFTSLIMPSDGWIGHSTLHNSSGGTGTSTQVSVAWFDAAAGAGNQLTEAHQTTAGALITIATSGADYSAWTTRLPAKSIPEGGRLFLFENILSGTVT